MLIEGEPIDPIPEESSRLSHSRQDSPSFDLLLKAYQRVRELQTENDELRRQVASHQQYQEQLLQLGEWICEKDTRIANLQRVNERHLMEIAKLESQIRKNRYEEDQDMGGDVCERTYTVPSQIPLHFAAMTPSHPREFTFDPQGRSTRSKPLQNCFSYAQMHSLVDKVQNRHKENDLKEYHRLCSSIERKYSPAKRTPIPSRSKYPIKNLQEKGAKVQELYLRGGTQKWQSQMRTASSFNRLH